MIVSAYLILITRRIKLSNKYPVKLRVVYLRKAKDYSTGIDLTEEEYSQAISERPSKELRNMAIKLNAAKTKANNIIENLEIFTFKKFEDAFYGRIKDASDVFVLYDEYIINLKKEGKIKNAICHLSAKNSFKSFRNKIGLYDITADLLNEYHSANAQRVIGGKKVGLSDTSIGIYVRSLRTIYNYAISLGIIKKDETYPFGKRQYVIPASRNIKKAFSIEEVKQIHAYSAIPGSPMDKARDFWMFSYLCNGINFKDISLLKNSNIDGEMLRFQRAKTKNTLRNNQSLISCHLALQAQIIISKWRSENYSPESYLFSVLSINDDPETEVKKIAQFIKTTNKYMKRISMELGLSRVATTYFGRHSAATILKRSGATIFQIQEALGHQNSSTTQKYLDSFDDESKKELSNSLSTFL